MTLTELATDRVVTAESNTPIPDALDMMEENHVGSVVITDGDGPSGIVTDRMIALALRGVDSISDTPVSDVMTTDPITISDNSTHFEALQTMSDEGIRRLPIVDDGGALQGIVTLDDLVLITAAELSNAADVIERQTNPT